VTTRFMTDSGEEVIVLGVASWSTQYVSVLWNGVPTCRPISLVLARLTPLERSHIVASKQNDPGIAASVIAIEPVREEEENEENGVAVFEGTVDDTVTENTPEENQAVVDEATSKPSSTPKASTPKKEKEKTPSTAEVGVAWVIKILEEHGPLTKEQLVELAEKSNPAKFPHATKPGRKIPRSTKWIVENKKVGQMIPGNASGWYIPEALDAGRNGGIQFVYADEEKKTLKVK
jgi:hypothetical protein